MERACACFALLCPTLPRSRSRSRQRSCRGSLDDIDVIPHVFGAFDNYFVVDMKIPYKATENFAFDFGIDNLFNEQYFLYHPFPGRTYVTAARYTF